MSLIFRFPTFSLIRFLVQINGWGFSCSNSALVVTICLIILLPFNSTDKIQPKKHRDIKVSPPLISIRVKPRLKRISIFKSAQKLLWEVVLEVNPQQLSNILKSFFRWHVFLQLRNFELHKGQLISKIILVSSNLPKIQWNFCKDFCHSL